MMVYAFYSSLVLALLYWVYFAFLCQETFHRVNRITLLLILAFSLALPVLPHSIDFSILKVLGIHMGILPETSANDSAVMHENEASVEQLYQTASWDLKYIAGVIYLCGVIGFLGLFIYRTLLLVLYLKQGLRQTDKHGNTIILIPGCKSPFSFFKYIVMSVDDYEQYQTPILRHEQEHIRQLHTLDLVLLTVVQVIQWFNPFVWMLGRDLKMIHEYEADKAMLNYGVDIKNYQYLLVNKCNGPSAFAMVNGFVHSQLVSRIIMLNKKQSKVLAYTRYTIFIPMLLLSFVLTAKPVDNYQVQDQGIETSETEVAFVLQGTVIDAISNEVIEGAVVMIDGTTKGTITSADGTFQREVELGQRLKVIMIDYETSVQTIEGKDRITIPLTRK